VDFEVLEVAGASAAMGAADAWERDFAVWFGFAGASSESSSSSSDEEGRSPGAAAF